MTEKIKDNAIEEVVTTEKTNGEIETNKIQPAKNKMKTFGIIVAIVFALATIFLVWNAFDAFLTKVPEGQADFRALGYLVIVMVWGAIFYGISFILNLSAMIVAIVNYKQNLIEKKTLTYFIVFAILPVIMWVFFYLLTFAFAIV